MEKFDPTVHVLCVDEALQPLRDEENPNLVAYFNTKFVMLLETEAFPEKLTTQVEMESIETSMMKTQETIGLGSGDSLANPDVMATTQDEFDDEDDRVAKNAAKWHDDNAIRHLIYLRKVKLKSLFDSTALSNQRKWQKLATELAAAKLGNKFWTFTWKQCEGKFKDLVKKYNKTKDNQKDTSSGAVPIRFKFYDDIEEVSRNSVSVKPLSTASNLTAGDDKILNNHGDAESSFSSQDESSNATERKEKKSKLENKVDSLLASIKQKDDEKERNQERRHKEVLTMQQTAIDTYQQVMNRLIDKL
ncbi:unnamed protein product [Ceutorhynchus assimilis]|uniref:Myb/SANT-like DNA-binding domain-containing protein n=1 Tax=Ceutorhynchus assimilis TaxID=467358 RepID=A0A9N9QMB8_9CUCU|nr:unnamed protein product [Ceutorhynchus assimilis]